MPNTVKYSTGSESQALRSGNFYLGVGDVSKGPTSSTGFWNGISPPVSGYTIYLNKASQGPSIYVPDNDSVLISLTNTLANSTFTSTTQCFNWYVTQNDKMVVNKDYPPIVTSGLVLNLDASFRPSYTGSGTTWYDVSVSANTSTLTNGPSFNIGGWIEFDGVDDFVGFNTGVTTSASGQMSEWSLDFTVKIIPQKIKSTQYFYLANKPGFFVGRTLLELTYFSNIYSITTDNSGNIFIAGRIVEYNQLERQFICKLDSSGNTITQFNTNLNITQTQSVTDIKLDSSNNLYYVGYNLGALVKLNSTTGANLQNITGVNASITQANMVIDNDKIYLGGWFTSIQGVSARKIARLTLSSMTIDTSFNTTTGFVNDEDVQAMVLQTDGKLIVGGQFTSYKGVSYNRIIRLNSDASIDTSFNVGSGFESVVARNSIQIQTDGKIIVGGSFTTFNGGTANRIIRLNSDGSKDSGFTYGTGFNGDVTGIKLQSDGKIIVCGNFTSYSGLTANRIVRLNSNGTIDSSFTTGSGFNDLVGSIHIQTDGKILVGGQFYRYSGITVNELCRLNTDGTLDTTFSSGTGILGAYRLNTQQIYKNSSNSISSNYFYLITAPNNYNWRKYETAVLPINNLFFNIFYTKDVSNNYKQYWNGVLRNTITITTALDTGLDLSRFGTFYGSLVEGRIYNRALTQSEILQNLYSGNIVTNGLMLYLDAGNLVSYPQYGTSWYDISSSGNNGTLVNGPTFSSDYGGLIVFDGVDDYGSTPSFSLSNTNSQISFEFWIKVNAPLSSIQTILSDGAQSNTVGYIFLYYNSNGTITYQFARTTTRSQVSATIFNSGYTDTWVNIAITTDYVTKQIKFYRNSILLSTQSMTDAQFPSVSRVKYLGAYNTSADFGKMYIGSMRIYTSVLSDNDVVQNYNATKSRFGL